MGKQKNMLPSMIRQYSGNDSASTEREERRSRSEARAQRRLIPFPSNNIRAQALWSEDRRNRATASDGARIFYLT